MNLKRFLSLNYLISFYCEKNQEIQIHYKFKNGFKIIRLKNLSVFSCLELSIRN